METTDKFRRRKGGDFGGLRGGEELDSRPTSSLPPPPPLISHLPLLLVDTFHFLFVGNHRACCHGNCRSSRVFLRVLSLNPGCFIPSEIFPKPGEHLVPDVLPAAGWRLLPPLTGGSSPPAAWRLLPSAKLTAAKRRRPVVEPLEVFSQQNSLKSAAQPSFYRFSGDIWHFQPVLSPEPARARPSSCPPPARLQPRHDDANVAKSSRRDGTRTVSGTSSVPAQKQADVRAHVHTLGSFNLFVICGE